MQPTARHIHIDPCGGVAGDMMMAALVDAFPDVEPALRDVFNRSPLKNVAMLDLRVEQDRGIRGLYAHVQSAGAGRKHRSLRDIRELLGQLPNKVGNRAADIFHRIGTAEAFVHQTALEDVHFHEVGAWDSIADIVGVSVLLEEIGPARWTCGPLPLGCGTVATAHGVLPVPTPATAEILKGMHVALGGPPVERVTPTGAAIIAHIGPKFSVPTRTKRLAKIGYGLGARRELASLNALRILVFDEINDLSGDTVGVLRFEVDDQTPEDLAIAIDHLRESPSVLDVIQAPVMAKKGRLATHVQVLINQDHLDSVIAEVFEETTTLGIRVATEERRVLERAPVLVTSATDNLKGKAARRPSGLTFKIEAEDLRHLRSHAERETARRTAATGASEHEY